MSRRLFLAYPLTTSVDLALLEQFVQQMRNELEAAGWIVLPVNGGIERLNATAHGQSHSSLLASNVAAVTGSDLLVVLVPPAREPSSIWIELGMAIACQLPFIIVGDNDAQIPFLGRLAILTDSSKPLGIRVRATIPPTTSERDGVIRQLVNAVKFSVDDSA